MKLFTILFALLFLGTTTMAQNSIIYKRNPATGVLEVYESQNGFPVGQRIGEIKENPVSGYVEITNYQKDKIIVEKESPYSRKPNYSVQEFTPYSLPYQSIINQIEALNRRHEYQLLENVPLKKTPNPKIEELKEALLTQLSLREHILHSGFEINWILKANGKELNSKGTLQSENVPENALLELKIISTGWANAGPEG